MTAKEYLKQAYLLDKQIQVEVKELEQLLLSGIWEQNR